MRLGMFNLMEMAVKIRVSCNNFEQRIFGFTDLRSNGIRIRYFIVRFIP
jgi:hypothetical protein